MKLEKNFKMILLFLAVVLFSCEPNAVETDPPEEQLEPSSLVFNRKSASEMTQLLKKQGLSFLVEGSNESGKSKPLYLGDVLETIDSLDNKNYSFNFNIDNQKENEFFNLVVNKSVNGIDAEPFVLKFISDESTLNEFETSSFDFLSFTGKIERYTLNSFLGSSSFSGKSGEPCDCVDVDNGDTGSGSGGGGGSSGPGGLNPVESCEWTSQTTHTIPDGRTFEFGPGSTCQHPGECEVVSFLVLKCQGQQSNKFSGCGSGCEDVNGPVAINLFTSIVDTFSDVLELSLAHKTFLRERRNESLLVEWSLFYNNNGKTQEAKNELKKQIAVAYSLGNDKLKPATGKIANNDAFTYTHKDTSFDNGKGVLYLLESGLFLAEYGNSDERGINEATVFDQDLSLSHNGKFYYAYNPDLENDYGVVNGYSLGWYEVIIPSESTNTGFESALIKALWEGAEFTGRYILPIEDVVIMIDGKDFDGVERNRVAAAGFFLVGLVPGGKITKAFKPLAKVVKGSEWYKIIKDGTNYVVKTIKVIPTAVMNKFETYSASGIKQHIDDLLRSGVYDDDVIEEASEVVADLYKKDGNRKLSWEKVRALFKRGNDFNKKAVDLQWYKYHEVTVEQLINGKKVKFRLDSYEDGSKIVSRKATDLANIQFSTFQGYIAEIKKKYPRGTKITAPKYSELKNKVLSGNYYLEIPDFNLSFSKLVEYKKYASDNGVTLIFKPE